MLMVTKVDNIYIIFLPYFRLNFGFKLLIPTYSRNKIQFLVLLNQSKLLPVCIFHFMYWFDLRQVFISS